MKTIIIFGLIAIAAAFPADVKFLSQNHNRDDHGQYAFNFASEDGIARTEQGRLTVNAEGTQNIFVSKGSYRYLTPEGEEVEAHWTAGKNFNNFQKMDSLSFCRNHK